eukprot:837148-Prymnesium_polylepis.1
MVYRLKPPWPRRACGVFCYKYNTLCCCVRMRALEVGAGENDQQNNDDTSPPIGLFPGGGRRASFAHARLPESAPPVSPPSPTNSDTQEKRHAKRASDTRLRSLLVQSHNPRANGISMSDSRGFGSSSHAALSAT